MTGRLIAAETIFSEQEVIIYGSFLKSNRTFTEQKISFAHEFAHLLPENDALFSRRNFLVGGQDDREPHAQAWALRFWFGEF